MASTTQDAILESLNEAQRRAVTSSASTVAILAGPGSGKTHTLTSRVVWLIQQAGYRPSDVIVATFTVKAAREMKERIGKRLGEECEKKIVLGTFHSIARRYLSIYGNRIGLDSKFGIADDGDSRAIIQRICKRLELSIEPQHAKSWISKEKAKGPNAMAPPPMQKGKKENPALRTCYQEYQAQLKRSNLLDYDDLLVKCVELLRDHPACVSNVQTVLIDEYQDTNGIQYELMKLFAQAKQRITIVGDPDQSIYGWRSAEVKNLFRLLREYPNTDEISLEENYRSSQSILDVSLTVIQQDKKRYKKVLLPVHTKGARPVLRTLKSSSSEGEWIVSEIKRVVMMFGDMLKFEDVAILLRSAALSRHIESALGKAGVAYRMIGGHKFYERKEIKVLIDYLRIVSQSDNNDALARIINVPRRGIGEATVKSLIEEAEQSNMSLWTLILKHCRGDRKAKANIRPKMEQKLNTELIRTITSLQKQASQINQSSPVTLVNLIEQLLIHLDFKKYLEEEYTEDHEQRWANVQEFVNLVSDFMKDFGAPEEDALPEIENLDQVKDDDMLGRFLANVSLASDAQNKGDTKDQKSLVTISTIHAAKGLEWPVVFVPSVYTGSIPHSRSEDTDEERRLLYVAMTRAQALLYLSCPLYGSQGMSSKVELSPFVAPFASKVFAKKGPSFDRAVIEGVAKILGRDAPSEKAVFGKLPPMFSVEDDGFPIDPIDPKNVERYDEESGRQYSRAPKRQRISNPTTYDESDELPWQREYATTMEQSSDFTLAALPGFTTAGAHRVALDAVAATAAQSASSKSGPKKGSTKRDVGQKSMLGWLNQGPNASKPPPEPRPQLQQQPRSLAQARYQSALLRQNSMSSGLPSLPEPQKPLIDPELAKHKLPIARPLARPNVPNINNGGPRKAYSCFSSSPPRPPSRQEPEEENKKAEEEAMPNKPASSLHATTFMSAKPNAGIRRPVGLGPAPTMDRLRKPFKPLTINRPKRPGG
ncbi:DNA helicase ii atp-dependent DNA helicase [Fusarium longipes]|uniref:DNA 3'-5' helicase n=1 Tax=Fusarium longipes TaxID=694270 RepID=A0A395T8X7_9HYPO|nr:DNA helicase ii atp-dependent DNA helicase [Fusarium longipes]